MAAKTRAAQTDSQQQQRRKKNSRAALKARKKRQRSVLIGAAMLAVAGLVAVLIPGLIGDSDAGTPSGVITIVGDDFSFAPMQVRGLAGEIEITLDNEGPGVHDLVVLEQGIRISARADFDENTSLGRISLVAPGESASEIFELDPGGYQIVCLIPGHLEAGMTADLTVE